MAPRSRSTFAKRQKEQARQEKRRAKAERKQQRKMGNQAPAENEAGGDALAVAEAPPPA
jgi:hypothetical protein